jgi:hypothetical protein
VALPTGGQIVDAGDVVGDCHAPEVIVGSQVEPFLSVSPTDPSFLAGVWQQDRFSGAAALGVAVAVSRDSGRTWSTRQVPYLTGCGDGSYRSVSDPQVGIGADGRIYVSAIAVGQHGQAILVSSSSDFGRSWSRPVLVRVDDGSVILDKPALLVDRYRPGTVHEVWVEYPRVAGESLSSLRVDSAFVSSSQDGGRTWTSPVRFYGSNSENQNHVPLELADGNLVDVFAEAYRLGMPASTELIRVVRSADGGKSWSSPVTAAHFPFSIVTSGSREYPIRASSQDLSAFAQGKSVYISWEYNTPKRSQIGVARSTDEGQTWTRAPDPVNGRVIAFLPEIAADARGTLALTWYQAAASPGRPTTLEFGVFNPGTAKWNIEALIGPFSLERATPSPQGYFLGDYQSLAPSPCGFRLFNSITTGAGTRITTTEVCQQLTPVGSASVTRRS